MAFKFAWLVELFQDLDNARVRKILPESRTSNPDHQILHQWFRKYGSKIHRTGRAGVAFLSCLFPERCPQRNYNVQEKRLSLVFGRALGLGHSRAGRLNQWQEKGGIDFASCVENVMAECEFDMPRPDNEVTLEELDATLTQIAANSPFSSPELQTKANGLRIDDLLGPLLRRLQSYQAKWLVRLLRKDLSPIQIPEIMAMNRFHFLLHDLLFIQNSLEAAIHTLGKPEICGLPPDPSKEYANALKILAGKAITPKLGIMIKRKPYEKARSIKHCCQITGDRSMSVERKYDGEYCQIHIDLSKSSDQIQIFSKSGKDSTWDRIRLQKTLQSGLAIGTDGCKIRANCILEGELLVWNRLTSNIEPFYKIRRHVMHGGRYLGIDADSPAKSTEQLMIMFYDILLLDGRPYINEPHIKRRKLLKNVVKCIPGRCGVAERLVIQFQAKHARRHLCGFFARAITQKWEGLVLKGCEDPYFSFRENGRSIKLKRDYITGLGDAVDLCIVGGRRDAVTEQEIGLGCLSWTSFYVACITNKDEVERFGSRPVFRIIDTIGQHCVPKDVFVDINREGKFRQIPFNLTQDEMVVSIDNPGIMKPTELFKEPFVVELYGAGFDKPSNCSFFTLRFARVRSFKLHTDRSILDTMTFNELQEMANQAMSTPVDEDTQEDARWINHLIRADGMYAFTLDSSHQTTPTKSPSSKANIAATLSVTPSTDTTLRFKLQDHNKSASWSPTTIPSRGTCPVSPTYLQVQSQSTAPSPCLKRKVHEIVVVTDNDITPKRLKAIESHKAMPTKKSQHSHRRPLAELINNSPQSSRPSYTTAPSLPSLPPTKEPKSQYLSITMDHTTLPIYITSMLSTFSPTETNPENISLDARIQALLKDTKASFTYSIDHLVEMFTQYNHPLLYSTRNPTTNDHDNNTLMAIVLVDIMKAEGTAKAILATGVALLKHLDKVHRTWKSSEEQNTAAAAAAQMSVMKKQKRTKILFLDYHALFHINGITTTTIATTTTNGTTNDTTANSAATVTTATTAAVVNEHTTKLRTKHLASCAGLKVHFAGGLEVGPAALMMQDEAESGTKDENTRKPSSPREFMARASWNWDVFTSA